MIKNSIKLMTFAVLIITLAILSFYIYYTNSKAPIKIGFDATLSGKNFDIGVAARNAFLLAVKEVNRDGGINGRKVELVIRDNEYDMYKAKSNIEYMVKEKIPVVIGAETSQMAELAIPYANSQRIVFISPTIAKAAYDKKDDNLIKTISSTSLQGQELAKHVNKKGFTKVAFISDLSNKAYTYEVKESFEKLYVNQDRKIAFSENIPADTDGFSYEELTHRLAAANVQCVVISASAAKAALVSQNIKKVSSIRPELYLSCWAMTNELLEVGGVNVEGAYTIEIVDINLNSVKMDKFKEEYRKVYGEAPGNFEIRGYDTALMLFDALRSCNNITPEEIKKNIVKRQFEGIHGIYHIDINGDYVEPYKLFKVINNKFVRVED